MKLVSPIPEDGSETDRASVNKDSLVELLVTKKQKTNHYTYSVYNFRELILE
jgi:hypothetical protein